MAPDNSDMRVVIAERRRGEESGLRGRAVGEEWVRRGMGGQWEEWVRRGVGGQWERSG